MGVDWNNVETWQRLVSAMYAAGGKPNLKEVATYFGATYDTLENRMRKVKKDADKLKEEAAGNAGGDKDTTTKTATKATTSTPRKTKSAKSALNTVASGRVTKTKQSTKPVVKQEGDMGSGSDLAVDSADMEVDEAAIEADGKVDMGFMENLYGNGESLFE